MRRPDQMTMDSANPIAAPGYVGQADHLESGSPTGREIRAEPVPDESR